MFHPYTHIHTYQWFVFIELSNRVTLAQLKHSYNDLSQLCDAYHHLPHTHLGSIWTIFKFNHLMFHDTVDCMYSDRKVLSLMVTKVEDYSIKPSNKVTLNKKKFLILFKK